MKKTVIAICAALLLGLSCAGCGGSPQDVSNRESVASGVKSSVGEAMSNVGEGVTDAVSAIVDRSEKMIEDGQISDGDGIIGNEGDNGEPATEPMTEPTDAR